MPEFNPVKIELYREIGKTARTIIAWVAILCAVYAITNYLEALFPAPTTKASSPR